MIDLDANKDEIKSQIKDLRDKVPELQDVKLSQNKDELIEDVEKALYLHDQNRAGSIPEDNVMESQTVEGAEEPAPEPNDDSEDEYDPEPLDSGPKPTFTETRFDR